MTPIFSPSATPRFDTVVVDEATQATEPRTLVAFQKAQKQLILVGDHQQLPPVVICDEALKNGLGVSMFDRLLRARGLFPVPPSADVEDDASKSSPLAQTNMLKIQYRMHPLIRQWPSEQFYHGQLQDGENVQQRGDHSEVGVRRELGRGLPGGFGAQAVCFLDTAASGAGGPLSSSRTVQFMQDFAAGGATDAARLFPPSGGPSLASWSTPPNKQVALALLRAARANVPNEEKTGGDFSSNGGGSKHNPHEVAVVQTALAAILALGYRDIGVISFYSAQVAELKTALKPHVAMLGEQKNSASSWEAGGQKKSSAAGPSSTTAAENSPVLKLEVKTVDGYQGREKEVIILSCVRTRTLGFVADYRRLNVAITRAKSLLVVVGDSALLGTDPVWASYLAFLRREKLVWGAG